MGYYTSHTLTVKHVKDREQFEAISEKLREFDIINYALDEGYYYEDMHEIEFYAYEACKWYESDHDINEISKLFPECVFKLHGEGEEPEDLWDSYYQNGTSEDCRAKVVYPKPLVIRWD